MTRAGTGSLRYVVTDETVEVRTPISEATIRWGGVARIDAVIARRSALPH